MTLVLHAGSRSGECYPSGNHISDIFGSEDRAAGLVLAEMYRGRSKTCDLIETEDTDVDCSGIVDVEDLDPAEYERWEALREAVQTVARDGNEALVLLAAQSIGARA